MGGGDLNTKKSWHPNTIKNQERVWKAEQAVAEEKKRIMELQKERAEERDREELNTLANRNVAVTSSQNDVRLNWMYEKPDKKGQAEDYLLGKSVDDNFNAPPQEKDVIPVVTRRVAGVSIVGGPGEAQVDLARKMREDPLLLVQERERAARAALLNNPIQRRKLTELLRKEQEQRKDKRSEKSKSKSSIDNLLASKLNALGNKDGGIDLAALLASDDSSDSDSDSSSGKKKKKKKKKTKDKKSKKDKKRKKSKKSDSDIEVNIKEHKSRRKDSDKIDTKYKRDKSCSRDRSPITQRSKQNNKHEDQKDRSAIYPHHSTHRTETQYKRKSRDRSSSSENTRRKAIKRKSPFERRHAQSVRQIRSKSKERASQKKGRLSSAERAAKLAEMVRDGHNNEISRGRRIAEQKKAEQNEVVARARPSHAVANSLPTSLQSRIQSNKHNIQRNKMHMNEHFARRY